MSAKPRLTFRGLAPGESPSVVIEIPLDAENTALAESVLGKLLGVEPRGDEPVAPLTTRGPMEITFGEHFPRKDVP